MTFFGVRTLTKETQKRFYLWVLEHIWLFCVQIILHPIEQIFCKNLFFIIQTRLFPTNLLSKSLLDKDSICIDYDFFLNYLIFSKAETWHIQWDLSRIRDCNFWGKKWPPKTRISRHLLVWKRIKRMKSTCFFTLYCLCQRLCMKLRIKCINFSGRT